MAEQNNQQESSSLPFTNPMKQVPSVSPAVNPITRSDKNITSRGNK